MKRLILLLAIVLLLIPTVVFASDVSNARWRGLIRTTNNGTGTAENVAVDVSINGTAGVTQGFWNSVLTDIALLFSGTDYAFQPGYNGSPWVFFVQTIGAQQNLDYDLYTGNVTGGKIRYFPDSTGMTIADATTMEPGDNFTAKLSGWLDTTSVGNTLINKLGAFTANVTATGNITAQIPNTDTWAIPTGSADPDAAWSNDANAYDNNIATFATNSITGVAWGNYLHLTQLDGYYDQVRFYAQGLNIDQIDVEFWIDGTWVDVYTGGFTASAWAEKTLNYGAYINRMRVRFHHNAAGADDASLGEIWFGRTPTCEATVSSGEHDITITRDTPFNSLGIDTTSDPITPVTDDLIVNIPCWQPEEYAASGGTFTTIDATALVATNTNTVWSADGYVFDGDDLITLTNNAILNFTSENFSFEFWVTFSDVSTNQRVYCRTSGSNDDGIIIFLNGATHNLALYTYQAGPAWQSSFTPALSASTLYHIVFTRDGASVRAYVNGIDVTQAPGTHVDPDSVAQVATIGRASFAVGEFLLGTLGEFRVYSGKALTPSEVLQNYNATKSKYTTGDIYTYSTLASVPDNANDCVVGSDATIYIEDFMFYKGGVLTCHTPWANGATFPDLSGNGNDATPAYRTTSSNANVSADMVSFGAVTEAKVSTFTLSSSYSVLTGTPSTPGTMYGGGDYTKLPAGAINDTLDAASVPRAAWWLPFLFLGICVIGMITYGATTLVRTGTLDGSTTLVEGTIDGSLVAMCIVMEVLLVILGKMGPIPLWPAYIFPIGAIAIILSKKHLSWG